MKRSLLVIIVVGLILGAAFLSISILPKPEGYEHIRETLTSIYEALEAEVAKLRRKYDPLAAECETLKASLSSLQANYSLLKSNYENLTTALSSLQSKYNSLQDEYRSLKVKYDEALNEVQLLKAQLKNITLYRNPTYKEAMDFIARDQTDKNEYIEGEYTCLNFAADVNRNAEAEGIRCAVVFIEFKGRREGHVLIAFETLDRGLIFIEPQTDKEVKVAIGVRYYRDNELAWTAPFDDTIVKITIIW